MKHNKRTTEAKPKVYHRPVFQEARQSSPIVQALMMEFDPRDFIDVTSGLLKGSNVKVMSTEVKHEKLRKAFERIVGKAERAQHDTLVEQVKRLREALEKYGECSADLYARGASGHDREWQLREAHNFAEQVLRETEVKK